MRRFDETFRQMAIKLRGMWAYRWVGLGTAWAVGLACVGTLLAMPTRYEATARIFVNTDSILKPLMTGLTVQPNDEQRIAMLSRVVISRPNVEKLVHEVGLERGTRTKEERERVVDVVMRTLEFRGGGRDNLYTLSFRDVDPARAKRAVEILANTFVESSKGGTSDDTQAAKNFIDEQVAVYERKLRDAESRMKEFRLRYLGMTPGEGRDYFVQMGETERQLTQARLELREAERARDAYRKELSGEEGAPGLASAADSEIAEVDARLDAMRRNLDSLLQRYTEDHPDVIGAKRVIRELETHRARLVAAHGGRGATSPASLAGPRAAETLKVSLAQSEASVASLSTRVSEYTRRYNKLRAEAALVPQLEAEYAQLNRDYEVNKKNYEGLVARRESANLSGEMQTVAGVSDFRLVDPPRVSPRPVSPKATILFPLALIAALCAGLLAAYVMSEARPSFYDARALREATALPVLGVISMVVTERTRLAKRRTALRFAGAAGALLVFFAAGFATLELLTVHTA